MQHQYAPVTIGATDASHASTIAGT